MSNDRSQRSLVLVAMLLTPSVLADDGVTPAACSADVCAVIVTDQGLVGAPCEGQSVLVAYSALGRATLIQCSSADAATETLIHAFNRQDAAATSYELSGFKFVRPEAVAGGAAGSASDGTRLNLCPDKTSTAPVMRGALPLAEKRPSGDSERPYCYAVGHLIEAHGVVMLTGEARDAARPLSASEARKWAPLRDRLSRIIPRGARQ
jgi:hypothetical protein